MKQPDRGSRTKFKKRLLAIFLVVLVGALIVGLQWATFARAPLSEALDALISDDIVTFTQEDWLIFSPPNGSPKTGFIFYPGGRVDPRGYAHLMRAIAAEGYLVVMPVMPFNIAAFAPNTADDIIAEYPDLDHWVIGGHSVGGTMAALYTDNHPEIIAGLTIWASYPADSTDLSDLDIPIVSIYGSRELRVNDSSVGERKKLLPQDTLYIRIEGGDHHQFGSYEINYEDHLATISRDSQQQQILQATLDLLETVANTN